MNGKVGVSKELNAKHTKILENLLKLPENRECADCKSRAPRWASVNLGVFICLQCSGIHRGLGVHISKVRSVTLDTWLPEQVEYIQSMGNMKANSYWEAELPPDCDRVRIENFIHAKYLEKKWIPRGGKASPKTAETKSRIDKSVPNNNVRHVHQGSKQHALEERKNSHLPNARNRTTSESKTPVLSEVNQQVISDPKPHEAAEKPIPAPTSPSPEPMKQQQATSAPVEPPPKVEVDYANELFNLLGMGNSKENGNELDSSDRSSSTDVETKSTAEGSRTAGRDVKADAGSLFDKSHMASPVLSSQQKSGMASQQQPSILAAPAQTYGVHPQYYNARPNKPAFNGVPVPTQQNCGTRGSQAPIMMQIPKGQQPKAVSSVSYPTQSQSIYAARQGAPINVSIGGRVALASTSKPRPSITPTPSGHDYDFSSLTQGMFTKQ